jgi:hypothetical protein
LGDGSVVTRLVVSHWLKGRSSRAFVDDIAAYRLTVRGSKHGDTTFGPYTLTPSMPGIEFQGVVVGETLIFDIAALDAQGQRIGGGHQEYIVTAEPSQRVEIQVIPDTVEITVVAVPGDYPPITPKDLEPGDEPAVDFTVEVSAYRNCPLVGQVSNLPSPENYRAAIYIRVPGLGVWTKPTFASPSVAISASGQFSANVCTGGVDETLEGAYVVIVPADYTPPQAAGSPDIPSIPADKLIVQAYRSVSH